MASVKRIRCWRIAWMNSGEFLLTIIAIMPATAARRIAVRVHRCLQCAVKHRWLRLTWRLVICWCLMVLVHEAGHIAAGWLGGGSLQHADLRPWGLPQSHFQPDPRPLLTLWGGPLLGAGLPLVVAIIVGRDLAWFVAHFCLLANGVYLALGWLSGAPWLDTPRLLAAGASPGLILLYCVVTISLGYPGFRRACMKVLS